MSPQRRAHVERVAALVQHWADAMQVGPHEQHRWLRAVWLHDALRDLSPAELERLAPDDDGPTDLRHGPAAAARAAAEGETDQGVLDAVRYHSIGYAGWDRVGRVLYSADFLEPGRAFDAAARADLSRRFPSEPDAVLLEVARRRLLHVVRSGWPLPAATVEFWNALASASSSR